MIPYLALGLFTGVRPLEIERLIWPDVLEQYIEIPAAKAKTRQRRLVSLSGNLKEWLTLGGDLPLINKRKRLARLLKLTQLKWQPDIMRHSFASYHLAYHGSPDRTAHELGHRDTSMLFAHYRELVTREAAQRYWAIRPQAFTVHQRRRTHMLRKLFSSFFDELYKCIYFVPLIINDLNHLRIVTFQPVCQ